MTGRVFLSQDWYDIAARAKASARQHPVASHDGTPVSPDIERPAAQPGGLPGVSPQLTPPAVNPAGCLFRQGETE
ncbi:MAG: hypothetical protein NBV67_00295 [Tagaea sp.]|nr:hypothetical protein [Tagaea sp.]